MTSPRPNHSLNRTARRRRWRAVRSRPVGSLGGDQVRHGGSGPDLRETPPRGLRTRDIYIPDLHIDSIKVKTRDFR